MDWRPESCPSLLDWRRQRSCQGVRRGGRLQRSHVHLNAATAQGDVKAVEQSPPAGVRETAPGQIVGVAVAGVFEPAGASHELELAPPLERAFRFEAAIVQRHELAFGEPDDPDVLLVEELRSALGELVQRTGTERLWVLVAAGSQRDEGADGEDDAGQQRGTEADAPGPGKATEPRN